MNKEDGILNMDSGIPKDLYVAEAQTRTRTPHTTSNTVPHPECLCQSEHEPNMDYLVAQRKT
jgi:hypothetical protein